MGLRTGFVKVAQSGKTIDGREIKPEWLLDAAATYSRDVYTALVYPDHNELGQNYGTVEALQATKEKDGTVSLFADLSPNAFWQSDLRYGQNAFTSIAVMPNFAGTGKWYLYSLAATNNPASLGIEKLEFSKKANTETLFSSAFNTANTETKTEPTDREIIGWFRKLLKLKPLEQEPDTMASTEYNDLKAKFDELAEKFTALSAAKTEKPDGTDTAQAAKFTALENENAELKTKVAELEGKTAQFDTLSTQFTELKAKLDAALAEDPTKSSQPSTQFTQVKEEDWV